MAAASTATARRAAAAPARTARPRTRPASRSRGSATSRSSGSAARTARPRSAARTARPRSAMPARLVPLAVGRTAFAVSGLADSGLVHRLTRGRLWIGAPDHAPGRDRLPERARAELQRVLEQGGQAGRRAEAGDLGLARRDRHRWRLQSADPGAAAKLGLIVPEPGSVGYLRPGHDDAAVAAQRLASGELTTQAFVRGAAGAGERADDDTHVRSGDRPDRGRAADPTAPATDATATTTTTETTSPPAASATGQEEAARPVAPQRRQAGDALKRDLALRAKIATDGASNQRIQAAAANLGLIVPEPGSVGYLRPSHDDAAVAAKRLASGELTAQASYVAPLAPVSVPTTTRPPLRRPTRPRSPQPTQTAPATDATAPRRPPARQAAPASGQGAGGVAPAGGGGVAAP